MIELLNLTFHNQHQHSHENTKQNPYNMSHPRQRKQENINRHHPHRKNFHKPKQTSPNAKS